MPSGEFNTTATEPTEAIPLSTVFCADDADVIIRAAGTRDFRAHKLILSLVSPIFKDMFTLPQPPTDNSDTIPRIDVEESAETWENLLRTIYPMPNPIIHDLDDLESLLFAAKKYEMQPIIDIHKSGFENRLFMRKDPLHLYAIACGCGLNDQARYVARNAEFLSVIRRPRDGDPRGLTVTSYRRLITFLVERDNELDPILERGWKSFISSCDCLTDGNGLYDKTKRKLKMPHIQMEEVYLRAMKDRARYYKEVCPKSKCIAMASEIQGFLKRMFKEREIVCDKYIWEE